jgi:hypothetical protein
METDTMFRVASFVNQVTSMAVLVLSEEGKVIDDDQFDASQLPGGAAGTAAIYTRSARATHLIRRGDLRMQAWLNYIIP